MEMERAGKSNSGGGGSRKSLSPSKDDSLKDFKSPKEQVAPVRVQIVSDKRRKKSSSKGKTSGNKKKQAAVKEVAQPSIESSFFKAAINGKRDGHTCPLCMKYFADTSAGTSHTKDCAEKNNVSTKKLLAAVALQERQASERVAIGLPAGPIVQPKDKTARRPRDPVAKGDPQLQLALALSKSLQEKQLQQEFEEALLLAGEHGEGEQIVGFSSDSERRKTLKNFGFLTNKPIGASEHPGRTRRKKHLGPTILQTRSQEARDRLLTERIAEILMGNEPITQVCQEEATGEVQPVKKRRVVLRSRLLKEIHRTTERLWDTAQLTTTRTNFYVDDLSPLIMPAVIQKQENPENTDEESSNTDETNHIKEEAAPSVSEESPLDEDDRMTEKMSESSEELERINKVARNRLESPTLNNVHITDRQYRNTLPMDWANTLNVSSMSDVVVLVENGHIWAHKLVFSVRCSDILLDCETNSDAKFSHVREKISWPDVDLPTGLAFLEFVYSGLIEKNVGVFGDERLASGVRRLARKYRIKALFDYLRRKRAEFERVKSVTEEIEARRSGLRSPIVIEADKTPSETESVHENLPASAESQDTEEDCQLSRSSPSKSLDKSSSAEAKVLTEKTVESDLQSRDTDAISVMSVASSRSCVSMSPDLFDETTEEAAPDIAKDIEEFDEKPDLSDDNSNLKLLADLIAQDDLSFSDEASVRSTTSSVVQHAISKESPPVVEANDVSFLSESHAETPRSRNHSTVDAATENNDEPRGRRYPEKLKSNLSLFIEKVHGINAKGPLDSSTEEESLAEFAVPKKRRNPFNVDNVSDASLLDSGEKIKSKRGRRWKEKRGLSVFDVQLEATTPTKGNSDEPTLADNSVDANETSRAEESCVVDDTVNTDDENISMYSKYRKTHKHNNSVSIYRNLMKKMANANETSEDDEKSNDPSSPDNRAIDLTQETDSEIDMPPSSMSGASNSSERKIVGNASDSDSIRTASTAIVNCSQTNASSDDECPKDAEISNIDDGKAKRLGSDGDLNENLETVPEYIIDTTPESVKSLRNSSRHSHRNLLDEDEEIFAHGWKTPTPSPCSSPSSSSAPLPAQFKRKSEERTKNDSFNDGLHNDEEVVPYNVPNSSSKDAKSSKNSPEYPDLDDFEINEEMFTQSLKKSCVTRRTTFTPSPKCGFDYSEKSTSSRRKRRAKERRTKQTSFDDSLVTKSPANASKYPDIDVDELLSLSLRNKDEVPRRSLTPAGNSSSDSSGSRSRRKRRSNGYGRKTRESLVDDLEKIKANKTSENARNSSEYHYDVFEPDNHVFTQSFSSSRLSTCRALSPLSNCASTSKDCKRSSTLKVPSPIVISSSPEIDLDTERSMPSYEQDCNKENRSAIDRSSPLFSRELHENVAEAITRTNPERSTLFSRELHENSAERMSPTNLERSTTPQPGTSRKYSGSNRGNSSSSAKTPLVRWNSLPANSSDGELRRKRSRTPKKFSRHVMSQDVTPPVNFDTMDTPKLKEELAKYGIKPQRRTRARQLLNYIYNELHPVVAVSPLENNSDDRMTLSNEDEPPTKKIGKPSNRTSDDSDSDREIPLSQQSATTAPPVIPEEMDYGDVSPDDSDDSTSTSSIKKAFIELIKEDREIYNKVLTYEPLPLDLLYLMLKARGLKCKRKDLMDFLDEECITFQVHNQRSRSNKTRGKKSARSGKGKANSQKS